MNISSRVDGRWKAKMMGGLEGYCIVQKGKDIFCVIFFVWYINYLSPETHSHIIEKDKSLILELEFLYSTVHCIVICILIEIED